jgi:hypothetical protein
LFAQKYCAKTSSADQPDDLAFRRPPTERTDGQQDLAFRLYRRVIEIDDGRLLRPYRSPATIVVMGHTARDACRIARRFLNFEDLILRFATRPDLDILANNVSEHGAKTAKRHQAVSGYRRSLAPRPLLPPAQLPRVGRRPRRHHARRHQLIASSGTP